MRSTSSICSFIDSSGVIKHINSNKSLWAYDVLKLGQFIEGDHVIIIFDDGYVVEYEIINDKSYLTPLRTIKFLVRPGY